jgi:hypothetical protein
LPGLRDEVLAFEFLVGIPPDLARDKNDPPSAAIPFA